MLRFGTTLIYERRARYQLMEFTLRREMTISHICSARRRRHAIIATMAMAFSASPLFVFARLCVSRAFISGQCRERTKNTEMIYGRRR